MSDYDPGDTRWLARRTAEAQREQRRVVKAVGSVEQNAHLRVAKVANQQRVACYTLTGSFLGLVRPAQLRPPGTVAKAGAAKLIACYDASGNLIGVADPKAIEGLAAGESFSYDATGQLAGIIGSDGKLRPVAAVKPAEEPAAPTGAERDAAATVAARAPTAPPTASPAVAKARRPMTWEQATVTLRQLRVKLERERVAKAQAFDTRGLGPRDEVIRLLDQLEPLLKMAAPPKPKQSDAVEYLRALGAAVIKAQVRKSGKASNTDPLVAAAIAYASAPPAFQVEVRKALARTSVESRKRARIAINAASATALGDGAVRKSMEPPTGELRIVSNGRGV